MHFYTLEDTPLLLGFSGGSDSTMLFYLLLEQEHPFEVAHVNHGWRPESSLEALEIMKICKKEGVTCHTCSLRSIDSNLEDYARKERHHFFQKICNDRKLRGVMLGHHADDQAETVLKRVFEGASLPKLKGLLPKTQIGELNLYRPLLKWKKSEILDWLKVRGISYFSDPTNKDHRFLRGRMREELLPTLSKQFGKQVQTSLCQLGESAQELADFLEFELEPFRKQFIYFDGNISLDFNKLNLKFPFIYKAIIRDFFEKENLTISKSTLNTLLSHLLKNSVCKRIQVGQRVVEIDRGKLTIKKLKLLSL
ncbi:MAG: tRNA lysidine(34) synthetase TilS [Chlamydiales bacterium]